VPAPGGNPVSMDPQKLLKMAEQITAKMDDTDDKALVASNVANHLQRFWDPRMQATLCDYANTPDAALSETLRAAVQILRSPAAD